MSVVALRFFRDVFCVSKGATLIAAFWGGGELDTVVGAVLEVEVEAALLRMGFTLRGGGGLEITPA